MKVQKRSILRAIFAVSMALMLSAPVLAQDAATTSDGDDVEELVITGSRAKPRTATDSTAPIDSFNAAELGYQASGDMTEAIKNLVPSYTATPLTGDGSAFVRSTSLRGLPPGEVLVLVNSKRRHRSALIQHFGSAMSAGDQAVDIGMIPSIALKRVEVLRDGAAAQYGSDAIAGVMNFILDDADEGGDLQVQYGRFYEGERSLKVAGNYGMSLTENGFLNVSAEYTDDQQLIRGFQPSAAAAAIAGGNMNVGQDSPYEGDTLAQTWGRPEAHGFRSVWNMGIDLGDDMELYSFGNFADTYGNYRFFYRAPNKSGVLTPVPMDPSNPSAGNNFSWGDLLPGGFTPFLEGNQRDLAMVAGLRGELSMGSGLLYDISASYGSNKIEYTLNNTLNPSWGPQSQRNFSPGDLEQFETNLNADFSYSLQENINLAFGGEWREENYRMFVGDLQSYAAGPWAAVGNLLDPDTGANYATPSIGSNGMSGAVPEAAGTYSRNNWALYADVEWEISDALLLQGAVRHEDFSDFGSTTNGKVAARFDVTDWFTLRGGYSTGFRAPTPGQSNWTGITTTFDGATGLQEQQGTVAPTSAIALALGGAALDAEDSENISVGFISTPMDDLTLAVDFYRIEVDGRLTKTQDLDVVDPLFTKVSFYTNSLNTETTGLDVVLTHAASLYEGSDTSFSMAYNYNKTEVTGQTAVGGIDPVTDSVIFNIENNLPKHRFVATVVHTIGKWSVMARANYYGDTIDERNNKEAVGSELFFDLSASYSLTDQLTVTAGGINIFDAYPNDITTRLGNGLAHPRRTPMGYDGGMWFMRLGYEF